MLDESRDYNCKSGIIPHEIVFNKCRRCFR